MRVKHYPNVVGKGKNEVNMHLLIKMMKRRKRLIKRMKRMIGKRVSMMKRIKRNRVQVKLLKKTAILNLDKGINNEYKTLLKNKGYDLPSEIFNEQKNVDDIIK